MRTMLRVIDDSYCIPQDHRDSLSRAYDASRHDEESSSAPTMGRQPTSSSVATLHALLEVLPRFEKNPDLLQNVTLGCSSTHSKKRTYRRRTTWPTIPTLTSLLRDRVRCVLERAGRKGVERPIFSAAIVGDPASGLWVRALETASGPFNQIADFAEARVTGAGKRDWPDASSWAIPGPAADPLRRHTFGPITPRHASSKRRRAH